MNKSVHNLNFDLKPYLKHGYTEEEIISTKEYFDIFDTQKTGSVNVKSTKFL